MYSRFHKQQRSARASRQDIQVIKHPDKISVRLGVALAAVVLALVGGLTSARPAEAQPTSTSYILQSDDAAALALQARAAGGRVTHDLRIISAVAAELTPDQLVDLRQNLPGLRVFGNGIARATGGKKGRGEDGTQGATFPNIDYPRLVGADKLHYEGIDGYGVTVAVLDTGNFSHSAIGRGPDNQIRILANYDATRDHLELDNPMLQTDDSGHGTHVASIILNSSN